MIVKLQTLYLRHNFIFPKGEYSTSGVVCTTVKRGSEQYTSDSFPLYQKLILELIQLPSHSTLPL